MWQVRSRHFSCPNCLSCRLKMWERDHVLGIEFYPIWGLTSDTIGGNFRKKVRTWKINLMVILLSLLSQLVMHKKQKQISIFDYFFWSVPFFSYFLFLCFEPTTKPNKLNNCKGKVAQCRGFKFELPHVIQPCFIPTYHMYVWYSVTSYITVSQ